MLRYLVSRKVRRQFVFHFPTQMITSHPSYSKSASGFDLRREKPNRLERLKYIAAWWNLSAARQSV